MFEKYLIKLGICILNLIYFVFKWLPCNRHKILFLSRQSNKPSIDFRMLANQLEEDTEVKIVMITKRIEKTFKDVILINIPLLLRQMYHLATSKVCIVDGYNISVSILHHKKKLKIFQIWHSLGPIKKFGYQSLYTSHQQMIAQEMKMHKNYDYIITASAESQKYLKQCFGYDDSYFIKGTLPRVEYLKTRGPVNREKIYRKYPQFKYKKVVLYAPTFRNIGKDKIIDVIGKFRDTKYIFILKLHPNMKKHFFQDSNIYFCDEFTTLQLLSIVNFVITDYSGVSFEASVLKKPIYIYAYDYQMYSQNPGINIDLKEEWGKYFFEDIDELYDCLNASKYDKTVVDKFSRKYIPDTHNVTQKLVDEIIEKGLNA